MTFPQHPVTPGEGATAGPDGSARPISPFGTDGPTSAINNFSANLSTGFSANRRKFLSWGGLAAGAVMVGGVASACGTAATGRSTGKTGGNSKGAGPGNGTGKGANGGDGGNGSAAVTRTGAAGDTFFIAGFQFDPPKSFNPLNAGPTWPAGQGSIQLLFETLVRFNLVSGDLEPGLATGLTDVNARTVQAKLQDGTKWQDGKALTSADVKFTFDLAKKTAVSYSSVWEYLQEVKVVDDQTVQFIAKAKPLNMLAIKSAIAGTYVLPQHIFETWVNNNTATSAPNLTNPVGSGPFQIKLADQTQIELSRYDNYWGNQTFGKPPMSTVTHPIFKSNDDGDLQFEEGNIDASQQFTTQIWKMWEKGSPVGTWLKDKPYYLPGSIPLLQFNTTKKGLDDPQVRLAIAYAIDTATIAATAMSSYSSVPQASLILPTGFEQKYFNQAAATSQGWKYDTNKATQILQGIGASKGSDGIWKLKDGTRLGPWKLITPTGWTDWNSACETVLKNLKAFGIDLATQFPTPADVTTSVQNGNFDMAVWGVSGVGPASPWQRFQDVLDYRIGAPIGKTAFSNLTRFKDTSVPALLDSAAAASTDAARKTAYGKLDEVFRKNVPVIPLMYRPLEFFEFQTGTWTNFPTSSNSYAPPMWQGAGIDWIFKLQKQGA